MAWLRRDELALDTHGRRSRRRRVGATGLVLVAAFLAGGIAIGASSATTTIKKFTAVLAPSTVGAGSTSPLTLTLANDPSSNQTLGSADVSVPTGFTVDGSSFALDRPWSVSLAGNVIELRAGSSKKALAPGTSLAVTFSATAPCATPQPPQWLTLVKQSNNFLGTGNDFTIVGDHPAVTVTGGGTAASFTIATISSPQAVGAPFSVTVTAKDACGNVASSYNGTPTITGLASAGASTPTYGTLAFSGGVATASVTAVAPQTGAQLTVSDGSATGVSNAFDVVGFLCTSSSTTCEASDDAGVTTVRAPVPQGDSKLAISFGDTGSGCVSNLIGSTITLDPLGYAASTQVTLEWDKSEAPGTGVANFILCWSKPSETAEVLPKCGKRPQGTCELKRNRNGAGDLEILVRLDPADPEFELG